MVHSEVILADKSLTEFFDAFVSLKDGILVMDGLREKFPGFLSRVASR